MEQQWERLRKKLLGVTELSKCYYDPPASIRMTYPCIIFNLSSNHVRYADNGTYKSRLRWNVTIVDPVSTNGEKYIALMTSLPYCTFDRHYVTDNLHHYTFVIYY